MTFQVIGVEKILGSRKFFKDPTKLFLFLRTFNMNVNDIKDENSEEPSPWKISVKPHSLKQMNSNSKGRSFLTTPGSDSSSTTFDRGYISYFYDDLQLASIHHLPFTVPAWIVGHALTLLKDRKAQHDHQKAQEMEMEVTHDKAYFSPFHQSHEKTPPLLNTKLSRKVSVATSLDNINEENSDPEFLDPRKMDAEIKAIQSNLEKLKQMLELKPIQLLIILIKERLVFTNKALGCMTS